MPDYRRAQRQVTTARRRFVTLTEPRASEPAAEAGAAVVEFVLVSLVAVVLAMSLAQLGLFLWERNALMGSLSEGARVAATEDRTVDDGRRVASELLRRSPRARGADAVLIHGTDPAGVVVLRAEGTLPSFVPGVPGLPVRMTARMHEEEALCPPAGFAARPGAHGRRQRPRDRRQPCAGARGGSRGRRWWSCWWCS